MATAIIPKSKFRENANISVGYGEVPAVILQSDFGEVQGWGLPGGEITFSEEEALVYATKLDQEIRSHLKSPNELLVAAK
tara:strand:- start:611 stop:850 length:240 start_codon:yes stop_codon:yes gene_type:complete